jgi:hypothetical protein
MPGFSRCGKTPIPKGVFSATSSAMLYVLQNQRRLQPLPATETRRSLPQVGKRRHWEAQLSWRSIPLHAI